MMPVTQLSAPAAMYSNFVTTDTCALEQDAYKVSLFDENTWTFYLKGCCCFFLNLNLHS